MTDKKLEEMISEVYSQGFKPDFSAVAQRISVPESGRSARLPFGLSSKMLSPRFKKTAVFVACSAAVLALVLCLGVFLKAQSLKTTESIAFDSFSVEDTEDLASFDTVAESAMEIAEINGARTGTSLPGAKVPNSEAKGFLSSGDMDVYSTPYDDSGEPDYYSFVYKDGAWHAYARQLN